MRVVASLTTIPDKYPKIIKCLESLNNQTVKLDAIYLGLPKKSRRLNIEYPPLPKEVLSLCTVVDVEDFGPITKILGGLLKEQDPETVIITFDDDIVYSTVLVEKLLRCHRKYPNSAIGSSGMLLKYNCPMCCIIPHQNHFPFTTVKPLIPAEGRKVDCIYGYPGALYMRKFFPSNKNLEKEFLNYSLLDDNMLMNDDIVISGYLSLKGTERRVFIGIPEVSYVRDEKGKREKANTEISRSIKKFYDRMNLAINKSKSIGMFSKTENVETFETLAGTGLFLIFVILVIVLLFVLITFLIRTNNLEAILT